MTWTLTQLQLQQSGPTGIYFCDLIYNIYDLIYLFMTLVILGEQSGAIYNFILRYI